MQVSLKWTRVKAAYAALLPFPFLLVGRAGGEVVHRERPRDCGAAEKRDEIAPRQFTGFPVALARNEIALGIWHEVKVGRANSAACQHNATVVATAAVARTRHADACQQCRVAEVKRSNATVVATPLLSLKRHEGF